MPKHESVNQSAEQLLPAEQRLAEINQVVDELVDRYLLTNLDPRQDDLATLHSAHLQHSYRKNYLQKVLRARLKLPAAWLGLRVDANRHDVDDFDPFYRQTLQQSACADIREVYYKHIYSLYKFNARLAKDYKRLIEQWGDTQVSPSRQPSVEAQLTADWLRTITHRPLETTSCDPLVMVLHMVNSRLIDLSINPNRWLKIAQNPFLLHRNVETWAYIDKAVRRQKIKQQVSILEHELTDASPAVKKAKLRQLNLRHDHVKYFEKLTHGFYAAWQAQEMDTLAVDNKEVTP